YSQLVPDMLIKDFIKETEKLLAGKFIANEITKVIKFRFYKNILLSDVSVDLTPYLCSRIKLETPEFKTIKITVSDKLTETEENVEDVERFEFDLLKESDMEILFRDDFEEADGAVFIKMVNTEGIIYLNSTFVMNGEKKESEDKAATILQLFTATDDWKATTIFDTGGRQLLVRFKESYPFLNTQFTGGAMSTIDRIKWMYDEYVSYFKNSNIPIRTTLMIPEYVFESIDQHLPVSLNGQKLLIEYLKKANTNVDSGVLTEAVFRTMRAYKNR
ncbi:MAG: hypothetical protein WBJ13_08790, partial [Sedimentibacter sp.]